ncbi:MAG: CHAT domain-containing protein [Bacteroidota bacterium]
MTEYLDIEDLLARLNKKKPAISQIIRELEEKSNQFPPSKRQRFLSLSERYKEHRRHIRRMLYRSGEEQEEAYLLLNDLIEFVSQLNTEEKGENKLPIPTRILFLASNPSSTARLRLDIEQREIKESIKRSSLREQFEFHTSTAARPLDLYRALMEFKPHIIHFSGHGEIVGDDEREQDSRALEWGKEMEDNLSGGIVLLDTQQEDKAKIVGADALTELFAGFKHIEAVILNACYSEVQGQAILKEVPYVIGMATAVNDWTAIAFARAYYEALGEGIDIETSFHLAKSYLKTENVAGHEIPVLLSGS